MAFKMKYSKGGFPYQSPLKDNHTRWARFKNKAGEFADKAEGWVEKAAYLPVVGRVASAVDAAKDSYDAYSAKKAGDTDRYKKEMIDVGANIAGVALGSGGKVLSTIGKKGLKAGLGQFAKEGAKNIVKKKGIINPTKKALVSKDDKDDKNDKDDKTKRGLYQGTKKSRLYS